jgi:hypothetical protein
MRQNFNFFAPDIVQNIIQAAQNGRLECLKYAHENGCPWDKLTCIYATKSGHLDCLKYAHENGCPGNEKYAHLL